MNANWYDIHSSRLPSVRCSTSSHSISLSLLAVPAFNTSRDTFLCYATGPSDPNCAICCTDCLFGAPFYTLKIILSCTAFRSRSPPSLPIPKHTSYLSLSSDCECAVPTNNKPHLSRPPTSGWPLFAGSYLLSCLPLQPSPFLPVPCAPAIYISFFLSLVQSSISDLVKAQLTPKPTASREHQSPLNYNEKTWIVCSIVSLISTTNYIL